MVEPDEHYMRAALVEARKGIGHTSPNPAVGAVLVSDGRIVSCGHHRAAGLPHAEIECLRTVGKPIAANATLFVTLEPCSTVGRTPPCTTAIIEAGIKRIVIGATDPNPLHSGRGINILRASGLDVRDGVLAAECDAINEPFNKWIRTRTPFVIAKCGMSLDGRLTRPAGESRWLTSAMSRRHSHRLRAQVDAILIGAETLRSDNPSLTVRGVPGAKQPWRVVLTRSGRLPRAAKLFTDRFADRTLVYRNRSLRAVLRDLGRREITSVLVEGGGEILAEALDERLIDKVQLYVAPLFTGGPVIAFAGRGASSSADAVRLERVSYERIGSDICVAAYVPRMRSPAAA
jgi:diaminohydroxyphosphoribosylaminopyrimidine deaminase/5-amino-6-(5-phosphoribosylamino)uracil reductase